MQDVPSMTSSKLITVRGRGVFKKLFKRGR
jgi:hypothetical protein